MSEKRHYARVDFIEQATLNCDGTITNVTLLDISLKGALLQCVAPFKIEPDIDCIISLQLEGSDITLEFTAHATHVHQKTIGFQFTSMDSDSMTHLRRLLELNTGNPDEIDRELSYMIHSH